MVEMDERSRIKIFEISSFWIEFKFDLVSIDESSPIISSVRSGPIFITAFQVQVWSRGMGGDIPLGIGGAALWESSKLIWVYKTYLYGRLFLGKRKLS